MCVCVGTVKLRCDAQETTVLGKRACAGAGAGADVAEYVSEYKENAI